MLKVKARAKPDHIGKQTEVYASGITAYEGGLRYQGKYYTGILMGDDETTGVGSIDTATCHEAEIWYTLDGRQLNGKPTARSIYVCNVRKMVITII